MKVSSGTGSMGTNSINLASGNEMATGFTKPSYGNMSFLQLNLLSSDLSSSALPALFVYSLNNLSSTDSSGFYSASPNSDGSESSVGGSIVSLRADAVPETSTIASLGALLGLGGLILAVRHRQMVAGKQREQKECGGGTMP